MDEHYQIPARVLHLGEQTATLQVGEQSLIWPRERVPEDVHEGDTVHVQLLSQQSALAERHEWGRAMLTEILGGQT